MKDTITSEHLLLQNYNPLKGVRKKAKSKYITLEKEACQTDTQNVSKILMQSGCLQIRRHSLQDSPLYPKCLQNQEWGDYNKEHEYSKEKELNQFLKY